MNEMKKEMKKETNDTIIKDIRNIFKRKKENEAIKDRVKGNITNK